jgi:hypothetical protein
MHRSGDAASLQREHFRKQALDALGSTPAQMALADLGPHQHTRACHPETLRRSFMRLDFIFSDSLLTWHSRTPLTQNSADFTHIRGCQQKPSVTIRFNAAIRDYFFFGILLGARTINMVRPSRAGACSTMETSARISATSFKSLSAISG